MHHEDLPGLEPGVMIRHEAQQLARGAEDKAKHVGVFGVDATEEAKAAIQAGSMDGTVMQDGKAMAEAMYTLAKNAIDGKDYIEGTDYQWDESGIAIRIPYKKFEM